MLSATMSCRPGGFGAAQPVTELQLRHSGSPGTISRPADSELLSVGSMWRWWEDLPIPRAVMQPICDEFPDVSH